MKLRRVAFAFAKLALAAIPVFNANSFTNALMWFDPTDNSKLSIATGVQTITDKVSGVVQTASGSGVTTLATLGGAQALKYVANGGFTGTTPATACTQMHVFIVASLDGTGSSYQEFVYIVTSSLQLYVAQKINVGAQFGSSEVDLLVANIVTTNNPCLIDYAIDTVAKTIVATITQANGTTSSGAVAFSSLATIAASQQMYLGFSSNGPIGLVGDVVFFSSVKTGAELKSIRGQLCQKWHISGDAYLSTGWNPTQATSAQCVLLLDADLGVAQSGGTVNGWTDQSGAGIAAIGVPSSSSYSPSFVPVGGADFGGTKNYLTFNGSQALTFGSIPLLSTTATIGARFVQKATSQYAPIIGKNLNSPQWYFGNDYNSGTSGFIQIHANNYASGAKTTTSALNQDSIVIGTFDTGAGVEQIFVNNGTPTLNTGTPGYTGQTSDQVVIGAESATAGLAWTGSIRRIAVFNGVLSSAERALFNTWLGS